MKETVVVAMSGGVDSAVSALLLMEQGYDVVGVNIKTYHYDESCDVQKKSCCSPEDVRDARDVGLQLQIPFYVVRMEDTFEKHVMGRFVEEYAAGRTPNPCVECNTFIKFGALFERARVLGIERIATGHYARIYRSPLGRYSIQNAVDEKKNQAYYLYGLSQEALSRTIFPLGGRTKPEVRELARKFGLPVADKAESQEICFVPENDYRSFLERRGLVFTPGFFKTLDGRILGKHAGKERFTIGQRKGLGIAWKEPLYVISIESNGDVIVGEDKERVDAAFDVEQVIFQGSEDPAGADFPPNSNTAPRAFEPFSCRVQIRYRSRPARARAHYLGYETALAPNGRPFGHRLRVELEEDVTSIAPGQSAVFYPPGDESPSDIVLAGGIISNVRRQILGPVNAGVRAANPQPISGPEF